MKKLWFLCVVLVLIFGLSYFHTSNAFSASSIITWSAPTKFVDGSLVTPNISITYNVYRSSSNLMPISSTTMIATGLTNTTYMDTDISLPGGNCYAITAVYNGIESAYSNIACKSSTNPPSGCSVK